MCCKIAQWDFDRCVQIAGARPELTSSGAASQLQPEPGEEKNSANPVQDNVICCKSLYF